MTRPRFVPFTDRFGQHDMPAESEPTFTLERQVAEARDLMGADRWHELMQDWEAE